MNLGFQKGRKEKDLVYPFAEIPSVEGGKVVCPKIGKRNSLVDFPLDQLGVLFNEVVRTRFEVSKGIYPQWIIDKYYPFKGEAPKGLTQPLIDEGLVTPKDCANVVHMDMPEAMPHAVLRWFNEEGVVLKKPQDSHIDFLGFVPDTNENVNDGIKWALHKAFEAKYFFGTLRPEEYLERTIGIDGKLMTEYPEGSPKHPSYPAGHGAAAAGGISRMIKRFVLTDYQLKVALDTAYLWAMFRTFAGVHYAIDNVAGLAIGGLGKYFDKEVLKEYIL